MRRVRLTIQVEALPLIVLVESLRQSDDLFTEEVLAELGFSADEIAALSEARAI